MAVAKRRGYVTRSDSYPPHRHVGLVVPQRWSLAGSLVANVERDDLGLGLASEGGVALVAGVGHSDQSVARHEPAVECGQELVGLVGLAAIEEDQFWCGSEDEIEGDEGLGGTS